jgi:hypothetical protein
MSPYAREAIRKMMRQALYLFCFFSMAVSALVRIVAALSPFDGRNVHWLMAIADPFPPLQNPYLRNLLGAIFLLIVLYFLLKRTLAFVRAGALNMPTAFTQLPFGSAALGLVFIGIVTLITSLPHNITWVALISVWLARTTIFLIPTAFLFTEIRSLLEGLNQTATRGERKNSASTPASKKATATPHNTRKLKPIKNRDVPRRAPLWSWIIYGLLWPCITIWIIQFFGKVALYDPARTTHDYLAGLAMAGVPAALAVGLLRLFLDPIFTGLAQQRSKLDMAEELLDSVALVGSGVAAEGLATAAVNSVSNNDAPATDNFTGGGGDFNGGGASGKF